MIRLLSLCNAGHEKTFLSRLS